MEIESITINRAPVLTLWAAIVAERLGFTHDEALTLGRAVAGLNAYSKGRALGIFKPTPKDVRAKREAKAKGKEVLQVELLHRAVPVVQTPEGLRALSKEQPIAGESVEKYSPASSRMRWVQCRPRWRTWRTRGIPRSWPPRLMAYMNSSGQPFPPVSRVGERRGRSVWREYGSWRKGNEAAAADAGGRAEMEDMLAEFAR